MSIRELENAAVRKNYVSEIYEEGVSQTKKYILNEIHYQHSKLHKEGYIHIHDLEAYGKVYNCSTPDLKGYFNYKELYKLSTHGAIMEIFNLYKELIVNLATNQSGGIGFANFDIDMSEHMRELEIRYTDDNVEFYKECLKSFVRWINTTRTRYCREPYYLTFNLGLSTSKWGRKVTELFLIIFMESPIVYTRPNIVFKVNRTINSRIGTTNFDLYELALACTAKRMIPTYMLTDSEPNDMCNPEQLGIMGCRTRVYDNINGKKTTIGRGNIACVSINLPRVALESKNISEFYYKLNNLMIAASNILKTRVEAILKNETEYLQFVKSNNLWINVTDRRKLIEQGTLSIGFIGLSETVEILSGLKYFNNNKGYNIAINIVSAMRSFVDEKSKEYRLNFSLLATPGEMISGRFCNIDKEIYNHKIHEKNFYTNSFHVDVDSRIPLLEKIQYEAPFHLLCNGGCITYVELYSAPFNNILALLDVIEYAEKVGISYLGFNYPLDICNVCGETGTFDECKCCGSRDIKRIRRVSGYLEDFNYFTIGKKAEVIKRKAND